MDRTRKLALAAMLAAMCAALALGGCLMPTGGFALLVAASMVPAAAVLRCGTGWGALCYAAAAGLVLLLAPGQPRAWLFVLALGHYGVTKSLIERLRRLPLEWLCKLLLCNGLLAVLWRLSAASLTLSLPVWALWLLGNGCFVLYDLGFTVMIGWFQRRFPGKT